MMLRDMLLESGGETYGVEWASLRWRAVTDVASMSGGGGAEVSKL